MAWRAARSLLMLHQQLKAGAPRAAPPATRADEWGLIGDALHDPTSDHSPHDFPGWGDDIVTAADFPNRPDLGLDARRVLDDIRRSQDRRVKYGISNGQMFSSYTSSGGIPPWTWRDYTGSDGHYTHGHLSVVGDSRSDGERPWATIGGSNMANLGYADNDGQFLCERVNALLSLNPAVMGPEKGKAFPAVELLKRLEQKVDALTARPAPTVDLPALAAALAPLLDDRLDASAVLEVLESPQGQAALSSAATTGANAAEDS